jgi:hypothetical protein
MRNETASKRPLLWLLGIAVLLLTLNAWLSALILVKIVALQTNVYSELKSIRVQVEGRH